MYLLHAPWLSWLQRPTVTCSRNRKVVSSSLTGAAAFLQAYQRVPLHSKHPAGSSQKEVTNAAGGVINRPFVRTTQTEILCSLASVQQLDVVVHNVGRQKMVFGVSLGHKSKPVEAQQNDQAGDRQNSILRSPPYLPR